MNENLDNLKEKLKDSVYLNSEGNFKRTPFKFLVGHVSLLLNIPNVIDKISSKNKSTTDSTNTDPVHLKKLLEKNIINHAAKKKHSISFKCKSINRGNFKQFGRHRVQM